MNFEKKGIINKHFFASLILFTGVIVIVLTFTSFLEEAQEKDISLNKKEIKK